jgi:Flp pilus assembly protein TadD
MNSRTAVAAVVVTIMVGAAALVVAVGWVRNQQQRAAIRAGEQRMAEEREAGRKEAVAAFTAPVPPTPAEEARFRPVFDGLGTALRRSDGAAVGGYFDPERMADELERFGAFARLGVRLDAKNRQDFKRGMGQLGSALVNNPLMRWDRSEVRRIRWSDDRTEAVVIAVHRDEVDDFPVSIKMRWWLVSRPGGWKVYDLEELDGGMRFTALVTGLMTPGFMANLPQFQTAATAIRDAVVAVQAGDATAADRALAPARGVNLPTPLVALRDAIDGLIQVMKGEVATGLAALDRAEQQNPDMPMLHLLRAIAYTRAGEFERALQNVRRYTDLLGPDPAAALFEGFALEGLGRAPEAAVAYRVVLDDTPNNPEALAGLLRTLPADKKSEIGDRLAKTKDPAARARELLTAAHETGDDAAAAAVTAALAKVRPGDPDAVGGELRRLVGGEKFDAAAALLRRGLNKVSTDDGRRTILDAYLLAMLRAGKSAEGYAAVPAAHAAHAFHTLADDLDDDLPDEDAAARLRELIAAHRKQMPADPWLGFYDAALLESAGEYAKAERLFAEAAARLADDPKAEGPTDACRYRRVSCLYKLKQGLKAHAEVGPAGATFDQLARLYLADKDAAGLGTLIGAHAAKAGTDPAVSYWRGELHYLKDEYAEAAAAFRAYRKSAGGEPPHMWSANDKLVRSLIRSDRSADAEAALAEVGVDRVSIGLRAAAAASAGRVSEVERLMAEQKDRPGGLLGFYADPDFGRLIGDPKFAKVRGKYPDPRPAKPDG